MRFRFGAFDLDEESGELRREGAPVAVQPKPLALLALLIRERERIVPLEELFETLWPGVAVTPGSLTRAVSHARRAIDDTHRGARIRSFPRRGYRFCGSVVELDRAAPPAEEPAGPAAEEPAPVPEGGIPFVGRAAALASLRGALDHAVAGNETLVLVSGPPGIGKSRLVEIFTEEVARRGPLVLRGRCHEGDGAPPFWLWAQIVRGLLADESAAPEVRRWMGDTPELAGLVPELAAGPGADGPPRAAPESGLAPEQSRFLFFEAVAKALSQASHLRPLVLVLEDLQWAGPPSLRLLEHLAFEAEPDPILLLATVREEPRERRHPVDRTLSVLRQQDRCVQVSLQGLTRGEVAALLERTLGRAAPADLTSELFARTEGVPLFLREALRRLEERGDLRHPERIARRGVSLPGRSLDLIRNALDALSEPCHALVGAAAVSGREFRLPLVAAVAGVSREEALDLLDEAARAGVVEADPEAVAGYRFSHALFQEAAYERLAPGERARLHQRTAERLERQHGPDLDRVVAELAHHLHEGIAVGDPEHAYACALRAADRAGRLFAHEKSAAHYAQAVSALEHCEAADPARRLETLLAYGDALRLAGDRRRRREVLADAMASARALGRGRDFVRAAIGFCDLAEWAVRDEAASAALGEALETLGQEPCPERARLLTRLAYLKIRGGREESEPVARRAVALARRFADPDALLEALYTLHFAIAGPDDLAERAELVAEMARAADDSTHRDTALIGAIDVASDRISQGDGAGARAWREQAARLAGESPHLGMVWHLRVYDAGLALAEGRFDDADALAHDAFLIGQRIQHPYARGCYVSQLALLHRERGEDEEVVELLSPALSARQGAVDWAKAVVGRARLALGLEAEARALYEELAEDGFRRIPRNIRWTDTLVETAALGAELGDGAGADALCELLEPVEHHHGVLPVPICYGGPVSRVLARLRALAGRAEEAEELYRDAHDACAALGARPMQARIQLEWAALHPSRARGKELRQASAALAATLGMPALEAEARTGL